MGVAVLDVNKCNKSIDKNMLYKLIVKKTVIYY